MIKYDSISKMLTVVAVLISLYLSTFEQGITIILYPVILLLSGVVLQRFMLRELSEVDSIFKEETSKQLIYYTAIAIAGIALTGIAVKYVPSQIVGMNIVLFGVLMAVAEEVFFRGFLTNFFITRFTPAIGILASAGIFAVYHFARYGTQISSLIYVLAGGTILGYVAYKSGRLSPVIIAHIINNLLAA